MFHKDEIQLSLTFSRSAASLATHNHKAAKTLFKVLKPIVEDRMRHRFDETNEKPVNLSVLISGKALLTRNVD